jgi:uncharacterized protein
MTLKFFDGAKLMAAPVALGAEPDQGVFTGLASVYGNKDRDGDVIVPGAFTKSIRENGSRVPLLWQHDQRMPIGVGEVADTSAGLQITAKLALRVADAQKAWELMKAGVVGSLSIGYQVPSGGSRVRNGVRELHEVRLWEVSLVTIPANPLASVQSMKDAGDQPGVDEIMQSLEQMPEKLQELAMATLMRHLASEIRSFSIRWRPRRA